MRTILVCAAILVAGCAAPRIDGSDPEKARLTIVKVRQSLPSDRQAEFDRHLEFLMRHGAEPPILADLRVREQINGKTGEEVIAAGAALQKEEEARAHDEKVKRDLADIRGSLSRIDARSPRVRITKEVAPSATSTQATASTVETAADPEIRALCTRNSPNPADVLECEKFEMGGKRVVNGALPDGVGVEVGGRIREDCKLRNPESYAARAGCEAGVVTELNMIAANPALMKQLPPDRQKELRRLAGQ